MSEDANQKALCELAQISEEDLLMTEWSNSQYRPCHYVALDRNNKKVMLVIRYDTPVQHYVLLYHIVKNCSLPCKCEPLQMC